MATNRTTDSCVRVCESLHICGMQRQGIRYGDTPGLRSAKSDVGTVEDKVHGTLLQCLRYLPYLDGAPFTVVRPPSNIATYRCILLRLSLQCSRLPLQCFRLPLQCSAFRCNIVFCPPLQFSSSFRRCTIHGTWCVRQKYYTLAQSTVFRCNVLAPIATLSSRLQRNATLSRCNAPQVPQHLLQHTLHRSR